MELRQLRYFAAVARIGTYAAAAESLHIAQPALWQQVHALERELGTPLFERVGRRVRLSRHGTALLDRVEQVLDSAELLVRQSRSVASGQSGLVVIACAPPHVSRFLALVIGRFRSAHPDVAVELREHPSLPGWPIDELLPGTADVALAARSAGFEGFPVYRANVSVPVPKGHRWHGRSEIAIAELDGQPLIVSTHPSLSRTLLERACAAAGFDPRIAFESPSPSTITSLGSAGVGLAVVMNDASATVSGSPVPLLRDRHGPLGAEVWLQWRRDVTTTPALVSFIDAARAAADATLLPARGAWPQRPERPGRGRSKRHLGRAAKAPRSTASPRRDRK